MIEDEDCVGGWFVIIFDWVLNVEVIEGDCCNDFFSYDLLFYVWGDVFCFLNFIDGNFDLCFCGIVGNCWGG